MKVTNFTLVIEDFDNDSMVNDRTNEVCRILRSVANQIEQNGVPNVDGSRLMDINGNQIGEVTLEMEDEWDGDDSDIAEIDGTYGSGNEPCTVFYCKRTNWYAIDGSDNVNQAPHGFEFKDGIDVELIADVDTMTAGSPVRSSEDLAQLVWEQENT